MWANQVQVSKHIFKKKCEPGLVQGKNIFLKINVDQAWSMAKNIFLKLCPGPKHIFKKKSEQAPATAKQYFLKKNVGQNIFLKCGPGTGQGTNHILKKNVGHTQSKAINIFLKKNVEQARAIAKPYF